VEGQRAELELNERLFCFVASPVSKSRFPAPNSAKMRAFLAKNSDFLAKNGQKFGFFVAGE